MQLHRYCVELLPAPSHAPIDLSVGSPLGVHCDFILPCEQALLRPAQC
jgi:hypothetical protein